MNKQQLIAEMQESFYGFIEGFNKIAETKINDFTGEGVWTAGELGRHVVLATQGGMKPKTKSADRPYDQWVDEIKQTFLNFNAKLSAPPFLKPEHTTYSREEILNALKQNLQQQIESVQTDDLTRINLEIELPGWGYLTGYEWMKLMIYHVQRHTTQLHRYH
jgi:hypothetical protein